MSQITYDFTGQVALVTGAAQGMGLAAARRFAEAGASVVLTDVQCDTLEAVTRELSEAGRSVLGITGDIANENFVKALIGQTVKAFGRLDMAFNNAGIQSPAEETADVSSETFDRIHAVNLRGVWLCMKYQLMQMRNQGNGTIVNNSSLGGLVGVPGRAAYHAASTGSSA